MLVELFTSLSEMLCASAFMAILASFIWGILSILLSPCHLASIPLIVGYIEQDKKMNTKRAFFLSAFFSLGILISIGIIGIVTSLIGRMLGDIGKFGNYSVALIFFIFGLNLLEIIEIPFLQNSPAAGKRGKGVFAAFVLGLIFGIALGPCTFAYMAPMLGVTFSVASTNIFFAVSLVFAYAVGHCSVIIFAGTFTDYLQRYLNWSKDSKGTVIIKKLCGILVIVGGVYLVYTS